jgi:hypothetical protein
MTTYSLLKLLHNNKLLSITTIIITLLLILPTTATTTAQPSACQLHTWSDIVISDNTEIRYDKTCDSFTAEFGCRFRNACCWNGAKNKCIPSNFNQVECPPRTSKSSCENDNLSGPYCWWDGTQCRRRCPLTSNPDALCAELISITNSPSIAPTRKFKSPTFPVPSNHPTPIPTFSPSLAPSRSPITLDMVLEMNSLVNIRCEHDNECDGYPFRVCFTDTSTKGWILRLLEDRVHFNDTKVGFCGCSRYWGKSGKDCLIPTSSLYYDLLILIVMLIFMVPVAYSATVDWFSRVIICECDNAHAMARLFQCLGALLFVGWKISELSTLISPTQAQLVEMTTIHVLCGITLGFIFLSFINMFGEWRVQIDHAQPLVRGQNIEDNEFLPSLFLIFPLIPTICLIVWWPNYFELWMICIFEVACIGLCYNTSKHVDEAIESTPIAMYELSRIKKYVVGTTRCLEISLFFALLGLLVTFLLTDSIHDVSFEIRAAYFLTRHAELFLAIGFAFSHRFLHYNVQYVFFDV